MANIEYVTIEVDDMTAGDRFYSDALGWGDRVRLQETKAPTTGFRGFTLSLVAAQPADADQIIDTALEAGATVLKPAEKSLWGYGGVVQARDGTICTVASSSKKNTGPANGHIDEFVLQLGVADVKLSKQFYVEHNFDVAQSYGRKYVQFDTGPTTLALYKRSALAKVAGVSADGTGSRRLAIHTDAEPFTDPDGFIWVRV